MAPPVAEAIRINAGGDTFADGYDLERHDNKDKPPMKNAPMTASKTSAEPKVHPDDPVKQQTHRATMALVSHEDATHVAVKSGSWFDPSTWENGKVPGDDARVVISKGVNVKYDGVSDDSLFTLRVDGTLHFATHKDTQIKLDTFVVANGGTLNIGSKANPVQADVETRIIIADNGAIDTQWDPQQLSRGVLSHGTVNIHGAEKTDFITLAKDAMAGDRELVLSKKPTGWAVGDQLVLGGTSTNAKGSHEDNSKFQDEVLTIAEINGNRVKFANNDISGGNKGVLRFDHSRPDVAEKDQLELYVANTTRNIIFETENADTVDTQARGHVMFMHNPDVTVENAGFYGLGRTDKTILVDDIDVNKDGRKGEGTNIRGRYALHFHRTGADDLSSNPSIVKGNAVVGSPGWGIVHHDSHANMEDNVVFDVAGAGIVQEAGNEIGLWRNNITIKTTGDNTRGTQFIDEDPRVMNFDFGFNGEGYWIQGAGLVKFQDNIAISTAGEGLTLMGTTDQGHEAREKQYVPVANLPPYLRDIAKGADDESVIDVAAVPTKIDGFTAYNAQTGLGTWKRTTNNDGVRNFEHTGKDREKPSHDYLSELNNLKLWNVQANGATFIYTSNHKIKDSLILGMGGGTGLDINQASNKIDLDGVTVKGFEQGMNVPMNGKDDVSPDFTASSIQNSTFADNEIDLAPVRRNSDPEDGLPAFFEISNTQFDAKAGNKASTAKFSSSVSGPVVEFDASNSFDPDAGKNAKDKNLIDRPGKGIVAYGWDFNNDGVIDDFGRTARHAFDQSGSHEVTLTVWDNQGKTKSTTQSVRVNQTVYGNAIQDGDFSETNVLKGGDHLSKDWFGKNVSVKQGAAVLANNANLSQVLYDQGVMKGKQTLSLDIKNTEGNQLKNKVTVSLWGINGDEFNIAPGQDGGPVQMNAIPMESTQLAQKTVGGNSFDWKTVNWNVDLGDGYDYLFVKVSGDQISNSTGDFVGIDNVSLGGGDSRGIRAAGKSAALMAVSGGDPLLHGGAANHANPAALRVEEPFQASPDLAADAGANMLANLELRDPSGVSLGLGDQQQTALESELAPTQELVTFPTLEGKSGVFTGLGA